MKDKNLVQARCTKGHLVRMWSSPLMVRRGSGNVNLWGSPLRCKCGAHVVAPK